MASDKPKQKPKSSGKALSQSDLPRLLCPTNYTNKLPAIPFPPKFLPFPFDADRYVKYKDTSLIRGYKYKVAFPNNGTIPVELLNPAKYATPVGARLDPTDEGLAKMAHSAKEQQRRQLMETQEPWLRKAEYMGAEVRFLGTATRVSENKVRAEPVVDEATGKSREFQIKSILQSFERAQEVPKHPTKPELTPVEIIPILPDEKLWVYSFWQVLFDTDPLSRKRSADVETDRLQQALVFTQRAEGNSEDFVSYFLPTAHSVAQRKRARIERTVAPDAVFEFDKIREYSFDVRRRGDSGEESYFFVFRRDEEGGPTVASYNEFVQRVRLTARRTAAGPSVRLRVHPRDWSEKELNEQDARLNELGTEDPFEES